jgi:hypothetical protein
VGRVAQTAPADARTEADARLRGSDAGAELPPRETVAGLEIGRDTIAFPSTAFDARTSGSRLQLEAADADAGPLTDLQTGSTWNACGLALERALRGTQLEQLVLIPQYWFAWAQFRPHTRVFAAKRR